MVDTGAWLVVGLGNPGDRYRGNRHNVGQMVVDELAADVGGSFSGHRAQAAVLSGRLGPLPGVRVILAKPTCYMNESGGPVAGLVKYFGVGDQLVVVHDELDIPFGEVRLKKGGGEGGHNGLRDISKALATKDYLRVRVGIGRPPGRMDAADFVLRDFSATERKELPFLVGDGADAVRVLIRDGLVAAQQRFHSR